MPQTRARGKFVPGERCAGTRAMAGPNASVMVAMATERTDQCVAQMARHTTMNVLSRGRHVGKAGQTLKWRMKADVEVSEQWMHFCWNFGVG